MHNNYGTLAEWGEVNCFRICRLMLVTGFEPLTQQLKRKMQFLSSTKSEHIVFVKVL